MKLFRIWNSDGETFVQEVSEEDVIYGIEKEEERPSDYLDHLPNRNANYWPENSMLLIRGEVITPRPKEVIKVSSWELQGGKS